MTLRWTTSRPTVPGWYWWRCDGYKPRVEQVFTRNGRLICWDLPINGEWSDQPIPIPVEP